ncbi:uncharacterized protein EDC63_102132 [Sulfurirhabdus autotrophica]|uniref:YecA family protein n=2 Tax=Sulfurirhabdus autotrophica TaxID=1706046 RepID=A0A4R3YFC6_9PROT|nr:uncharacterized protein EDC63_102132 [Sulfurirhabdus autotrophica]
MQATGPMTEEQIKQLETWLVSPVFKGKAMPLDKLQGLLCAVVSSPDVIPASRWIAEVLGTKPTIESEAQINEFMGLLMGFYNHVVSQFMDDGQHLNLMLKAESQGDERDSYQSWCDGYILGWSLSKQEWMTPGNEPLKKLTFPILLLSGAFKEDAENRGEEFMPPDEYEKLVLECMAVLPDSVFKIYNYWLAQRKHSPVKRDTPKVGRNDTCPCGSGKKYKQCCGQSRTLH